MGNRKLEMIEVVNRQRRRKIDPKQWQGFGENALQAIGTNRTGATIAFVSDDAIKKLNRGFRGQGDVTDVLSFPAEQSEFETVEGLSLGDVVISIEQATRQAKEHGLSLEHEVSQLILHGLLHLSGYDHETDRGEMNRLELRLRRRLGI
jgi:probable rRNA maturation factor